MISHFILFFQLYAQNCRKRRVAHIKNLANELQQIKAEKEKLCNVQDSLKLKFIDVESRYNQLYAYVMNVSWFRNKNVHSLFSPSHINKSTVFTCCLDFSGTTS